MVALVIGLVILRGKSDGKYDVKPSEAIVTVTLKMGEGRKKVGGRTLVPPLMPCWA